MVPARAAPAGIDLSGTIAGALDGTPFRIDYAIECGADWLTRSVRVVHRHGAAPPQRLEIRCEAGRWTIEGAHAAALDGATDIDLGFSPSTNTLPIRRLGLTVGASAVIHTAWLRFPEFELVRGEQRYTRTAERVYRYERRLCGRHRGRRRRPRHRLRRVAAHWCERSRVARRQPRLSERRRRSRGRESASAR
jgi:hypothetical protein